MLYIILCLLNQKQAFKYDMHLDMSHSFKALSICVKCQMLGCMCWRHPHLKEMV